MHSNVSPRLNAALLEDKYAQWKKDPQSVEPTWSSFFEGFELGSSQPAKASPGDVGPSRVPAAATSDEELSFRARVGALVYAYRTIGHTAAWTDPLSKKAPHQPELELEEFGFTKADLDRPAASVYYKGGQYMPLRDTISSLRSTYCGHIGFEFMHIHRRKVRNWLRDRIEGRNPEVEATPEAQTKALAWLAESEIFEHYLHKKFVGEKRFSLEGGESLLVILNTILEKCPEVGLKELVMGMAHRGRLNVLAN
ncbi:MAG: 2-oxoglutarate dehydrogenase E1 component, partial [Verrucomicrobiota bacterium]